MYKRVRERAENGTYHLAYENTGETPCISVFGEICKNNIQPFIVTKLTEPDWFDSDPILKGVYVRHNDGSLGKTNMI